MAVWRLLLLISGTSFSIIPISLSKTYDAGYAIRFRAPSQPNVVCKSGREKILIEADTQPITTFSGGEGESHVRLRSFPQPVQVLLALPGETTYSTYSFNIWETEAAIPHAEITSLSGKTITYTPEESTSVTFRYTRLQSDYDVQELNWMFLGVNGDDNQEGLQIAASDYPPNFMRRRTDSYNQVTTELDLWTEGGLLIVSVHYNGGGLVEIHTTEIFYLQQAGHTRPLPTDFIGITFDRRGGYLPMETIRCSSGQPCRLYCAAVGESITTVEIVRKGGSHVLEPNVVLTQSQWFYAAEFQIMSFSANDVENYMCRARNANNRSQERQLTEREY